MTYADKAFDIAEQRIAWAKREGWGFVCLSPQGGAYEDIVWNDDEALAHLSTIPTSIATVDRLERLALDDTKVADLSSLVRMTSMRTLQLKNTLVADLTPLARMEELLLLDLRGTQVSKLTPLAEMKSLQVLDFSDTQVADLSPLADMEVMQRLNMNDTEVIDLSPIENWKNLRTLRVEGTRITDLRPVSSFESLNWLYLRNTQTDMSVLVSNAASWRDVDHDLRRIVFSAASVEDDLLKRLSQFEPSSQIGSRVLARLRELRDMVPRQAGSSQSPPSGPYTFLSYARSDATTAANLRGSLEADTIAIWQDVDMPGDRQWEAELRTKIDNAAALLVLWSGASTDRPAVKAEARRAEEQGKLVQAGISALDLSDLPLPFGEYQLPDLSDWAGEADHKGYQAVLTALRMKTIGAQSPVTVRFNDDGLMEPAERPVGAAPLREDEVKKNRLLRAQAELSRDLAEVVEEELGAELSNADKRLILRIQGYERALRSNEDLIWETLNASFERANGLIRVDELDDGMAPTVALWRRQHDDLQDFIQPAQTPGDAAPDDQVSPDDVGEVVEELADVAAELAAKDAPVTSPVPRLLQSHADRLARERDDPDGPSEASVQAGRSRTGKAVRAALGVLTGVASGATVHTWSATAEGAALLNRMVALAEKLFALL